MTSSHSKAMEAEGFRSLRLVAGAEFPTLESLYRDYAKRVATVGFRIMGRTNELEDYVHDVFVEVHRSLHTLQEPAAAKQWLNRIAVRHAIRRVRSSRWKRWMRLETTIDEIDIEDPGVSPEDAVLLGETLRRLRRIPPRARACWVLRAVEGYELKEVAEAVGCSLATTKRDIARADRALRRGQV